MTTSLASFIEFCIDQHDTVCNQKYADKFPYSFHLNMVYNQFLLFQHLVPVDEPYYSAVMCGIYGHDLIEDARVTYSDIQGRSNSLVADIIYCCTEEKGRTRDERHNQKYFDVLKENDLAVFVKLCDIIANVKFGIITNSGMVAKYKKEFPKVKSELRLDGRYDEMFDYLEKMFSVAEV